MAKKSEKVEIEMRAVSDDDMNYVIEATLLDTSGKPIPSAELSLVNNSNGQPSARYSDGSGYTNHGVLGQEGDLITFQTNGYRITAASDQPSIGPQYLYLSPNTTIKIQLTLDSFKKGYRPSPILTRSPLPEFGEPINYRTELPWEPPTDNRDYLRMDAWGVVIPHAPVVPGTSSRHPERILSWFLDRYSKQFQEDYLGTYDGLGYSHIKLSLADSVGKVDNGSNSPPGNGRSLDQFIETCLFAKKYVKYVQVMLGSKYFMDFQGRIGNCSHNMSGQQWADWSGPLLEALIKAKCMDECIPGWEWNLWNEPGKSSIDAYRFVGSTCHSAGISCWEHFAPHYTSWQANDDDRGRFGWYDDLAGYVDGLNYQTMGPNWSHSMFQARIVDTLWLFGERGNDFKMRMEEDYAAWMFDNDEVTVQQEEEEGTTTVNVTPDYANQRGYIAACTIDDVKRTDAKVWGYGNGARRPSGDRL